MASEQSILHCYCQPLLLFHFAKYFQICISELYFSIVKEDS